MSLNGVNGENERRESVVKEREKEARELLENHEKLRGLSVSVVRVWSKTFKGNTSWAIVDMIGSALEIYAGMLEEDLG
ncbi:MAG: hypothetical protein M1823_008225, partial [Watsoniomyces obsoletus]